jgi:type IV pilus assembly protein PilV
MPTVVSPLRRRRQRGLSIVEALVALLVLSVGMLGIAVMYLESVRANRTALSRTLAVHLVNDMADRIRANRMALGAYDADFGTPPTAPTGPGTDCAANDCTAAKLAAYDLSQWYQAVVNALPRGADGNSLPEVQVKYQGGDTSNDPARYTVTARWKDVGSDDYLVSTVEFTAIGST